MAPNNELTPDVPPQLHPEMYSDHEQAYKQAEEALRRSERDLRHAHDLLRYVVEHARSAVAVHDHDLHYIFVSQRYLDAYHLQGQEVIGRHHYAVMPDLPQKWRDVHQRALAGEVIRADDDLCVRPDGTPEWTRWECRPWYEADGTVGGIVVYIEIITDRKQAELSLRTSEENYRQLAETSDSAITVLDRDGCIRYANPVSLRLWQDPALVGKSIHALLPPALADEYLAVIRRVIDSHVPELNELELPVLGQVMWFRVSLSPIKNQDGTVDTLVMNGIDIGAQKQVELQQQFQINFWQLATDLSTALTTVTDEAALDAIVADAVRRLGELFAADRCYLLRLTDDLTALSVTQEWCAAGVSPTIDLVQDVPLAEFAWTQDLVLSRVVVHVPSVADLPATAVAERRDLADQGVKALLCLPVIGAHVHLFGYLGFDMTQRTRRWEDAHIAMLRVVADTLGNTLERLRAEAIHQKVQQRLTLLAQNIPGMIYQFRLRPDGSSHFPYASVGIRAVYGVAPEDVQEDATPVFQVLHPDDVARVSATITESAANLTPWHAIYRVHHPMGHTLWVEGRATPQRLADGSTLWHGHIQDVSAREQAARLLALRLELIEFATIHSLEATMRKTLDELEDLTGSVIGFYHFVEEDQNTISLQTWSTRTRQEFCRAEGEGMHYPIDQAGVWADCVRERRPIIHNNYAALPHRQGLPEGHAPVIRELVVPVLREGNLVSILGVGNKSTDYTEDDVNLVSYMADLVWEIVDRKRKEEALWIKDRALETSINALALADLTGRLTYVNRAFLHYWGYTDRAQVLLRHVSEFWNSPDEPKQVLKALGTQGYWQGELRARRVDGTLFDAEVAANLVRDDESKPVCMQATFVDVTERKSLQARLLQAQKMETVGQLAGGIAHDFNNMLAVIMLRTETSLPLVEPDSRLHRNLTNILTTAQRSAVLVRQLLGFARKQVIMPHVLDLNTEISSHLSMLHRLIGEEIELVWRPAPAVWPLILDSSQVDQILMNLCANARDAINGVGVITVSTGTVTVDTNLAARLAGPGGRTLAAGDYVTLTVSDTGSGMDAATLAHIFEPFFTTKPIGQGTGLGLANIYGIIQQNNGHIQVTSAVGAGTTFTIYLPRVQDAVAEAAHGQETGTLPQGHGKTALLVEDEHAVLEMAREVLQTLGYTVLAAAKPAAALQLALTHRGTLDLLITDIAMPEMNGRELTQRITAVHPNIKVLYISGYPLGMAAERGVLESGVHFLHKPFTVSQLAVKAQEAMEDRA